jgi:hypothetical protein
VTVKKLFISRTHGVLPKVISRPSFADDDDAAAPGLLDDVP